MLKNVKSYFLRFLFSIIQEKQKLELIKYNKNLQEMLNISLINYKYFSGSFIIFESNEKGKEFLFDGELIFEGEYLNRKRNGKGKEYLDNVKLIFEGEYLNGKKSGKGKEYDYDGQLIFEGEFLNGVRNGKGKEYGSIKFEGEY